jgi:hypothetical protein
MSKFTKLASVLSVGLVLSQLAAPLAASPLGGAKSAVHQVLAHDTDHFNVTFRADEEATVMISGDNDTDLDFYIYDENGNLITSDTDSTDDCVLTFTPKWTGEFRIEVKNLGSVYNEYSIVVL